MTKYVYFFGKDQTEGDPKRRDLLGGKGAGLSEMTSLGLPVPEGFTITTEACAAFQKDGALPAPIVAEIEEADGIRPSGLGILDTSLEKAEGSPPQTFIPRLRDLLPVR